MMNVNLVSSTQKTTKADEYLEFSLRASIEQKQEPPPAKAGPDAKPAAKKGGKP
jgi:hypothetical protein